MVNSFRTQKEYIYIKLITLFKHNITQTNLSFLGGQLGKNSDQSKNKQEQKRDIYWGKWNNINENYVRRHG